MNTTTFIINDTELVVCTWQDVPVFETIETEHEHLQERLDADEPQWTPIGRLRDRRHYWWVHTALKAYAMGANKSIEVENPPPRALLVAQEDGDDYEDGTLF